MFGAEIMVSALIPTSQHSPYAFYSISASHPVYVFFRAVSNSLVIVLAHALVSRMLVSAERKPALTLSVTSFWITCVLVPLITIAFTFPPRRAYRVQQFYQRYHDQISFFYSRACFFLYHQSKFHLPLLCQITCLNPCQNRKPHGGVAT